MISLIFRLVGISLLLLILSPVVFYSSVATGFWFGYSAGLTFLMFCIFGASVLIVEPVSFFRQYGV